MKPDKSTLGWNEDSVIVLYCNVECYCLRKRIHWFFSPQCDSLQVSFLLCTVHFMLFSWGVICLTFIFLGNIKWKA